MLGGVQSVEVIDEIDGRQSGVDQHTLCGHRVCGDALNFNGNASSIEGFIHHFTKLAGVEGVGEGDREIGEIHGLGPQKADFLVGDEGDVDVAVTGFRVSDEFGESGHDRGDAGLVVGAKHAGAVCDDNILADVAFDFRVFGSAQPQALLLVQADVSPGVGGHDARFHFRRKMHIDRVEVCQKANGGYFSAVVRGQAGGEARGKDGLFGQLDVGKTQGFQFSLEQAGQVHLARGAGQNAGLGIALAADGGVAEKIGDEFLAKGFRR